jgi:hypothetical protein
MQMFTMISMGATITNRRLQFGIATTEIIINLFTMICMVAMITNKSLSFVFAPTKNVVNMFTMISMDAPPKEPRQVSAIPVECAFSVLKCRQCKRSLSVYFLQEPHKERQKKFEQKVDVCFEVISLLLKPVLLHVNLLYSVTDYLRYHISL